MAAKTISDIRDVIDDYSDLSDTDVLSLYRKVRDQIVVAAFTEHGTKIIEIRNRRHEVSDPATFLKAVEQLIGYYSNKVARVTNGPATNFARLSRSR
jgi:hypothetical protein